jgi:hypothetical protein
LEGTDKRDVDPEFPKRIAAINASMRYAQAYLDWNEQKFDPQWFLARADWISTGRARITTASPSEPRCGSEAISEMESGVPYGIPVTLRSPVHLQPRTQSRWASRLLRTPWIEKGTLGGVRFEQRYPTSECHLTPDLQPLVLPTGIRRGVHIHLHVAAIRR